MHRDDDLESWEHFVYETPYPWCWSCGRSEKPRDWYAPWVCPQRAHLASGSGSLCRRRDRRQACLLCPLCHGLQRPKASLGKISNANMLWLKERYDYDYYDREYLRRYWIGVLPEADPIGDSFTDQYVQRRGPRPASPQVGGTSTH